MARVTTAQRRFLEHHQIPLVRVFDATGMRRTDYQLQMSALGKLVAIGVTPCSRAGHMMRTVAGHCAECNPAGFAFLLRYDSPGEVYVAKTGQGQFVKVGSAINALARMRSLNNYRYGGVEDWRIEFCEASSTAGRIEFAAHQILSKLAVAGTYFKEGRDIECREIFICSVAVAVQAVRVAITNTAAPSCGSLGAFVS